jgi:hypothetical protein
MQLACSHKMESKPKNFVPPQVKGSGRPKKFTEDQLKDVQFNTSREAILIAAGLQEMPSLANTVERSMQHDLKKYLKMPLMSYGHETSVDLHNDGEKAQFCQAVCFLGP